MKAWSVGLLFVAVVACAGKHVHVNFGYFEGAAAHMWTYGVDSHSWTDPISGDEFLFRFWPQTSGGRVFEKVSVGDLDFAVLGNAPWARSSTRSLPAKLVYDIKTIDKSEVLACRSDIVKPKDLRGKRVAYVPGSTAHYAMDALLSVTSLSYSDFEWIGGLNPGDQQTAWDAGEIDCGLLWMPQLGHLQSAPWCSSPDPSRTSTWRSTLGVPWRPCAEGPRGVAGHTFFTCGMAQIWGESVWNGLVVSDAFAAAYPRTVERSLKMLTAMDTKYNENQGFFFQSENRLCMICVALGISCDAAGYARARSDMLLDYFMTFEEQRSPVFLGQQVPGQCALESIPLSVNATTTCTKLTASGLTLSMHASANFDYSLKNLQYLPPLKHYQDHVDSHYMDLIGTADESFASVTADTLASTFTTSLQRVSDNASNLCQDMPQPILLTTPGTFQDHEGSGFYTERASCTWQIHQRTPVLLSDISVRTEVKLDRLQIYGGLCTFAARDCGKPVAPLLAVFSGGKGRPQNIASRPPVLVPGGSVTIVFSPDGVIDRPLMNAVAEGVSLTWSTVAAGGCPLPCHNGGHCVDSQCRCSGGWAGADCTYAACLGTSQLLAATSPAAVAHGPAPGTVHGADCRWVIRAASPDEVVVLEFLSLDVEAYRDPLEIYEGDAVLNARLLGTYSGFVPASLGYPVGEVCPGASCPKTVVSNGSTMLVRWTSDFVQGGNGFQLRYVTAKRSDVACGYGETARCSGHGECTPHGCRCDDGAFGVFCQFKQCARGVTVSVAQPSGVIRNMASSELGYSPLRDCVWQIAPSALVDSSERPGAIMFFVESFDVEGDFRSSDRVTIGGIVLSGRQPPCSEDTVCREASDCRGGACSGGHCKCPPIIVAAMGVTVNFQTDLNDVPAGSHHKGFKLRYKAVYSCPRNARTGMCLAPDECAEHRMVPGEASCEQCPPGSIFKQVGGVPTCEGCAPGFFHDVEAQKCRVCEAGRYTSVAGRTKCTACSAGYECPLEASGMSSCRPGHFAAYDGMDLCLPCATGNYSEGVGATRCQTCGAGKEKPEAWTTIVSVQTAGGDDYSKAMGATSRTACGCEEGFRVDHRGECIKCGEGLLCKLRSVEIEAGYYVKFKNASEDASISVYRCKPAEACPGGKLDEEQSCAGRRTGFLCTQCPQGTYAAGADCNDCDGGSYAVIVILALFLLAALVVITVAGGSMHPAAAGPHSSAALKILALALMFMQSLGAINNIGISWKEPFKAVCDFMALLNFDIDVIKLGCIRISGPVSVYIMKMIVPLVGIAVMLLMWFVLRILSKGTISFDGVLNGVGTVFTIFYIAQTVAAFSPYSCFQHPNGELSMTWAPEVLCNNDDRHVAMVGVSVFGILAYPVTIFGVTAFAVWRYPYVIIGNNFHFVTRLGFIFHRWTPDCYWFGMVILVRNFLVAVLPILIPKSDYTLAILLVEFVMLIMACMLLAYRPWKLAMLTSCDAGLNLGLLMLLAVGSVQHVSTAYGIVCTVLFAACILSAGVLLLRCTLQHMRGPTFDVFVSHHKKDAGCGARLLKLTLSTKFTGGVFLDCDDLMVLGNLFDHVKQSKTMLVILSGDTLTRPWCLAEIAQAFLSNIHMFAVTFTASLGNDANPKTAEEVSKLNGIATLYPFGISTSDIEQGIAQLLNRGLRHVPLDSSSGFECAVSSMCGEMSAAKSRSVGVVSKILLNRVLIFATSKSQTESVGTLLGAETEDPKVWLLTNHDSTEAMAAARVVKFMFQKLAQLEVVLDIGYSVPSFLAAMKSSPPKGDRRSVLWTLTSGTLANAKQMVRGVLLRRYRHAYFTPVVVGDSFAFPSQEILKTLSETGGPFGATATAVLSEAAGEVVKPADVAESLQSIFANLAVIANVPNASEAMLKQSMKTMIARLAAQGVYKDGASGAACAPPSDSGAKSAAVADQADPPSPQASDKEQTTPQDHEKTDIALHVSEEASSRSRESIRRSTAPWRTSPFGA